LAYRRTDQIIAKLGQTRRAILTAAHTLVAEGGFSAVQMTEVARRADLATGTLYRYFPAKEDLCRQVYREIAARELKLLASLQAGDGPASERLAAALRLFATRAARGQRVAHALLIEAVDPALEEERKAFRRAQGEIFSMLLQGGMSEGSVSACDAAASAAALMGAITGALVATPDSGANTSKESTIEETLRFCHAAIGLS